MRENRRTSLLKRLAPAAFLPAIVFLAVLGFAVTASAATLSGKIYGGSSPLTGANVALNDESQNVLGTVTTVSGNFSFAVGEGSYSLTIDAVGFQDCVVNGIVVTSGDVAQDVVLLQLAPPPPVPTDPIPPKIYTISGLIRWPDGTPLPGSRVNILAERDDFSATALADASGAYQLTVTETIAMDDEFQMNLTVYAGAQVPLQVTATVPWFTLAGDRIQNFTLPWPATTGSMSGFIRDPLGALVPGARVSTSKTQASGGATYSASTASVTADATGFYAVPMIYPGPCFPWVYQPVGNTTYTSTSGGSVSVTGAVIRDFVLQYRPPPTVHMNYTLSGVVRWPDGTPLPGSQVHLESAAPEVDTSVLTDAAGAYQFTILDTVAVDADGFQMVVTIPAGSGALTQVTATTSWFELTGDRVQDFVIPWPSVPGSLSGYVRDPLGAIVPGARVATSKTQTSGGVTYRTNMYGLTADATGYYTGSHYEGMASAIITRPTGNTVYAPSTSGGAVSVIGAMTRDFTINFAPPPPPPPVMYTLSGVVRWPDGTPLPGSRVYLESDPPDVDEYVFADASGAYRFTVPASLAPDLDFTMAVTVYVGGTVPIQVAATVPRFVLTGDKTLNFVLPWPGTATLSGRTTDANGVPVKGVTIRATRTETVSGVTYSYTTSKISAVNGSYSLASYALGAATFTISPPFGSGFRGATVSGVPFLSDRFLNVILARPDTTPPRILATPQMSGIADATAVVSWQTDEPSKGGVKFGVASPPATAVAETAFTTSHSVTLAGLAPDTLYYLGVYGSDVTGNGPTESGIISFRTKPLPDTQPPSFSAALSSRPLTTTPRSSSGARASRAREW